MDIYCNPSELQHKESIVVVDMATKEKKLQPFASLSKGTEFFPAKITCENGQTKTVMVPVDKILVYPLGADGQLTSSPKNVVALLVEYFDKQGNMLESTRFNVAPFK